MKIIIPIAGLGTRFKKRGIASKPLALVKGIPMINRVVYNLGFHEYCFIINKEDKSKADLIKAIKQVPKSIFYETEETEGAACTVLKAKEFITSSPLMVINCDQIIEDYSNIMLEYFVQKYKPDAVLGVFTSISPKNSYVKLNEKGEITETKEKEVISNIATNGLHYWTNGLDFVKSAEKMITSKDKHNGEYYIAPTFNYMIEEGKKVLPYFYNLHFPIGTPEDLERYESL